MARRPRVVILGGGIAGLTAAWELSMGDWRDRFDAITLYQRGWRLGGKGASSRGVNGRIEEHGLHVLLGYYDATFRLMREVYAELDRPRTDPGAPIRTWEEAVSPSRHVGLTDRDDGGWEAWVTGFSPNGRAPGEPDAEERNVNVTELAGRSLRHLLDFHRGSPATADPRMPPGGRTATDRGEPVRMARGLGLTALASALEALSRVAGNGASTPPTAVGRALASLLGPLRREMASVVLESPDGRRTFQLVDLVFTNLKGIVADRLLTRPEGFAAIDHLDYRDWLRRHGADAGTVDSAIVRGMYDLVFAYEAGDPGRPRFSAGLGLQLATRMLYDFKGAIFWRMEAGMGEIVFAPLYQVLRTRGVRFEFFNRVDNLRLTDDRNAIEAIDIGRQVDLRPGLDEYRPLASVGGLPCWPPAPDASQLVGGAGTELESLWGPAGDAATVELIAGRDFDHVVFAISLGMVPYVCSELLEADGRWRDMVDNVATVATQSFQLWLGPDERALGWRGPRGVTLSAFAEPFGTWASMSHLIESESWSPTERPGSIAYFCGPMPDDAGAMEGDPGEPRHQVRAAATSFLDRDLVRLWPGAAGDDGAFRYEVLHGDDGIGRARFDSQYWRANVDPSDRYVQSLPGTDRYRIKPDETGFSNLLIAGDWTDCGLNAGCIEAAVRSGRSAARAILLERAGMGRPTEEEP